MAEKSFVAAEECGAFDAPSGTIESFANSSVMLGSLPVSRALPVRGRRLVGPWCFLDRFGPLTFAEEKPMDVAPHPHIGLQTVTWLLEGEIRHDDSLGCAAVARPNGVNVMTAGRGIAHTEQTPPRNSHRLDGVQLWVALPDHVRQDAPAFHAIDEVPLAEQSTGLIRVFAGTFAGVTSPAPHFSSIVGVDLQVHAKGCLEVAFDPRCEHAVLVLQGDATLERHPLSGQHLHYLGTGRSSVAFHSHSGCRLLLIGGEPFPEKILMWWNFVGRTPEEIAAAREDWQDHRRFGDVQAYRGARLDAPALIRFAQPNPIS